MVEIKLDSKEFFKWLAAQPDERVVDMGNSSRKSGDEDCGCVMVEYARDNFDGFVEIWAGYNNILISMKGEAWPGKSYVFDRGIFNSHISQMKTMGEVKEYFAAEIAALS